MDYNRLSDALQPPGKGDFSLSRDGGLCLLEPVTADAKGWLRASVGKEATWLGGTLVVEDRYLPALVEQIIAAGLTFERDVAAD